jgi:hypothetical protein
LNFSRIIEANSRCDESPAIYWTFPPNHNSFRPLLIQLEIPPTQIIMSLNVGLSTPRGSGTSGYVQRNLSHLKPRDRAAPYNLDAMPRHKEREPDAEILEHERKRAIEVKVFELRDQLEEDGLDEDEIDKRTDELRSQLQKESAKNKGKGDGRKLKGYEVHEAARRKKEEDKRVRKALGIREDYEEGGHWRRQEERKKEGELKREEDERRAGEQREIEKEKESRRDDSEEASESNYDEREKD